MNRRFLDAQVLVTGGAGFIGSHLVERLVSEGAKVTVVDNLITGNVLNLKEVTDRIEFIETEVVEWTRKLRDANDEIRDTYTVEEPGIGNSKPSTYDYMFHLASPASPKGYMNHPELTYLVNALGTHYLSQVALAHHARFLFTSTSESYGDPLEHPQTETYWGNVNPIGPRACYDESKRFGEMVVTNAVRNHQLDGRVVRIFNTYGPRMDPLDGRVFPSFISQALKGEPIAVAGDGSQTRSFCYVTDMVELLMRAMATDGIAGEVINLGNPQEYTILEMANMIKTMTRSSSEITFTDLPADDPVRRKPDITKAKALLGYEPIVPLHEGLTKTIEFFRSTV